MIQMGAQHKQRKKSALATAEPSAKCKMRSRHVYCSMPW